MNFWVASSCFSTDQLFWCKINKPRTYSLKSLVAVSERFLEMPAFDVGLQGDLKIYGIGQFGLDSFQIFIRGRLDFQPGDRTLQAFVRWQKAHGEAGPEPGGAQP